MKLSRTTLCSKIDILAPRWHDRVVLIAKYKVSTHNEVVFTKAKSLPGTYYLSAETIRKYPLETNGKIECYAVPLHELEVLERED